MAKRTRNWLFVFYQESAPDDWQRIIESWLVQAFVSPLHDGDKNADDTEKKPHWHCILAFDSVKTFDQVKALTDQVKGTIPIPCNSYRQACRYLCHLDQPSKAQYSQDDVISFGGLDYVAAIAAPSDKYALLQEMQEFCDEQGIYSLRQLTIYAREQRHDWFIALSDNCAFFMTEYLKSAWWEDSQNR